jgi:acyl carrier protein
VYDRLKDILISSFQVRPADFKPEATLEDLELDSLDVVELSLVISERLRVRVTEDELAELRRVAAIVQVIEDRVAQVAG